MTTATVKCDGCDEQIKAKFMTCSECGLIDLCKKCFPQRSNIHAEHDSWERGAFPSPIIKPVGEKRTVSAPSTPGGKMNDLRNIKEKLSPPNKRQTVEPPPFPFQAAPAASSPQPSDAMMAMLQNINTNMTTKTDLLSLKQDIMKDTRVAIAESVDPLKSEMHDLQERIEKLETGDARGSSSRPDRAAKRHVALRECTRPYDRPLLFVGSERQAEALKGLLHRIFNGRGRPRVSPPHWWEGQYLPVVTWCAYGQTKQDPCEHGAGLGALEG